MPFQKFVKSIPDVIMVSNIFLNIATETSPQVFSSARYGVTRASGGVTSGGVGSGGVSSGGVASGGVASGGKRGWLKHSGEKGDEQPLG